MSQELLGILHNEQSRLLVCLQRIYLQKSNFESIAALRSIFSTNIMYMLNDSIDEEINLLNIMLFE